MKLTVTRRHVLGAAATLAMPHIARAAAQNIKYLNDWRWEGPGCGVLLANKGLFQKERLEVSLTPGTGSGATVAKVASGEFDIGLGDFSSLIEHAGKNPGTTPPVAVYAHYERMPAALFMRKSSASKPEELAGKKIGAPPFDAGRKLWPLLAKQMQLGEVQWVNVDAAQREKKFAAGEVDAITGFQFTSMLNIEREGMSGSRYTVFPFYEASLRLYGNVLVVNPKFLEANGPSVRGFVRAYNLALKDTLRQTRESVKLLREVQPDTDLELEWRRARLAFDHFVATPSALADGLGTMDAQRVKSQIDMVAEALKLPAKPTVQAVFNPAFLPNLEERKLRT